jgi:hypothetical protein
MAACSPSLLRPWLGWYVGHPGGITSVLISHSSIARIPLHRLDNMDPNRFVPTSIFVFAWYEPSEYLSGG